ncbi:MAG: type III-B CRISPR module RAMP protein Cmr6 [Pseudomonadota bacterium]|nr:type III-B CRISPR module RAMP protein Cmr6 [Pseudomonadota bacterium]
MPISATPAYLGQNFSTASPGLRFGMYLPLWDTDLCSIVTDSKTKALQQACKLTANDKAVINALVDRQSHLASACPHLLTLDATAVAPFTTGLGNEHPLENGFAFLNPYGLPYLPGSGVKGVLRQAARELAKGDWGDTHGWTDEKIYRLQRTGEKDIALTPLDVLFGLENTDGSTEHVRGALSFWDALPKIHGEALAVDIMTPHQSHYHQQKKDRESGSSTTPHDSGKPSPISFLTLPPGTEFAFHVQCDRAHLKHLAPELADNCHWQKLVMAAFMHAFEWLGFGAKTAVGYGAMKIDERATNRRAQARQEADKTARMASLSPAQRQIQEFEDELRAKHEQYPAYKEGPNAAFHNKARQLAKAAHEATDWSADEKRAAALAIETWLPKLVRVEMKEERKKLGLAALKGL